MTLVDIWADTRGRAVCRGCRQWIEWAEIVKTGKRMPFDEIVVAGMRFERARWIETVDLTRNHWASCAQADRFRRKQP